MFDYSKQSSKNPKGICIVFYEWLWISREILVSMNIVKVSCVNL